MQHMHPSSAKPPPDQGSDKQDLKHLARPPVNRPFARAHGTCVLLHLECVGDLLVLYIRPFHSSRLAAVVLKVVPKRPSDAIGPYAGDRVYSASVSLSYPSIEPSPCRVRGHSRGFVELVHASCTFRALENSVDILVQIRASNKVSEEFWVIGRTGDVQISRKAKFGSPVAGL